MPAQAKAPKSKNDYKTDGCSSCDECEEITAQTVDLIIEARNSPIAKEKLGRLKIILKAGLASGLFLIINNYCLVAVVLK